REYDFLYISDSIPVCILEVIDIRGTGDENTAVPRQDAIGIRQPARKLCAVVEPPIPIPVFKSRDTSQTTWRPSFGRIRIPPIFHDIKYLILIKGKSYRIHYQWF